MAEITIKDIAKICGVGISTVSRAINDDPGINENTRNRILKVIEEYHYIPNNSARHLKMTESNTVALLVKGIDNQFFQGMLKIFEEELKQLKYTFLLHAVDEEQKSMDVAVALAKERRLKGVIFLGGRIDTTDNRLKNMGIPYVMCTVAVDMTAPGRDCSSVSIDDEKESYRVVEYLCLKGYKQALRDHGIDIEEKLIRHMKHEIPEYSIENGYMVTKELMESEVSFTALYAISDLTAFGAYKAILEAGKKIPDDYSVIGFDGIDISKYFHPSLTTMKQPCEEMVKSSIKLLMEAIHGQNEKKQCIFQADLIERESVKTLK